MTLPPASKVRAFLTASQPADSIKKPADNSVKLIHPIVSDTAHAWQLLSPAIRVKQIFHGPAENILRLLA
jgi:hypothetical protein